MDPANGAAELGVTGFGLPRPELRARPRPARGQRPRRARQTLTKRLPSPPRYALAGAPNVAAPRAFASLPTKAQTRPTGVAPFHCGSLLSGYGLKLSVNVADLSGSGWGPLANDPAA